MHSNVCTHLRLVINIKVGDGSCSLHGWLDDADERSVFGIIVDEIVVKVDHG